MRCTTIFYISVLYCTYTFTIERWQDGTFSPFLAFPQRSNLLWRFPIIFTLRKINLIHSNDFHVTVQQYTLAVRIILLLYSEIVTVKWFIFLSEEPNYLRDNHQTYYGWVWWIPIAQCSWSNARTGSVKWEIKCERMRMDVFIKISNRCQGNYKQMLRKCEQMSRKCRANENNSEQMPS